jgi:lysophospholipase L1-like esterase
MNKSFGNIAAVIAALILAAHIAPLAAQTSNAPLPVLTAGNTATNPVPRDEKWVKRHEGFLAQAKANQINVLFLGDSITDFWQTRGSNVWNQYYAPRQAADFGISADRTQHVLWRIAQGELDGLKPKVVVLLIGTNNTGKEKTSDKIRNTTEEAIEGVTAVVKAVHAKLPGSKLLLLGIFPRGEANDPQRQQIKEINSAIAKLADNSSIVYLDIGDQFLSADGSLSKEIMPDLLHPSEKGYAIWAKAMEPTLAAMLGAK